MFLTHVVTEYETGKNVRFILEYRLDFSNKLITKLKQQPDGILLNGKRVFTNHIINTGDIVSCNIDFNEDSLNVVAQELPIDILFEDDALIILNKTAGIVVHPTFNHPDNTLANALAYYYIAHNQNHKIHPVNRLDRGTSGIVVFAKNRFIHRKLCSDSNFERIYTALVHGIFEPLSGTIDMPIARVDQSLIERHVSPSGKHAITHYNTIEVFNPNSSCKFSLVKFRLETGRTHQIRVHCHHLGHPIYGDSLYYIDKFSRLDVLKNTKGMDHQALHSSKISFIHPLTKHTLEISCPLPTDISDIVNFFRTEDINSTGF